MITKADIDQRAKDIGLTASQVTPTLRVALLAAMIEERGGVDFATQAGRIATASEHLAA